MLKTKRNEIQEAALSDISARCLIAISIIALFSILAFVLNLNTRQRMEEDFKVINISGRQRMLTQRISLLFEKGNDKELKVSLDEFIHGLNFLDTTRFVKKDYPQVFNIYHGSNGVFSVSESFVSLVNQGFQENKEEIFRESQELLQAYDQATSQTQKISEIEFQKSRLFEWIILLITLVLLLLVVLFIFRPMIKKARSTYATLNKLEDDSLASSRLALLGEITASVGHEIRNPLAIILTITGETGLRRIERDLDYDFKKAFDKINTSAQRISKIVDALAVQSRDSSNDVMSKTPIQKIVSDAVEMFKPRMKYASINLVCNYNFDGDLDCKQSAITQVVANLVSNAIDAIEEGQTTGDKEIRIETKLDEEKLYIRVFDSGPGVPLDLSEKIFESFVTTKVVGKGTGLGLSISKKIMEDHGGSLNVNSQFSDSCFEMQFPARSCKAK